MKKLLLSSAVMFFLCSISFAQQSKQVSSPKENKNLLLAPAQQVQLGQKTIPEHEAQQKSLTPEKKSEMEAKKIQTEKLDKDRKLILKNEQKAELAPRANPAQ